MTCGTCNGRRYIATLGCASCGGSGKKICPCWSNIFEKCNNCDAYRYTRCMNCGGSGNALVRCRACN